MISSEQNNVEKCASDRNKMPRMPARTDRGGRSLRSLWVLPVLLLLSDSASISMDRPATEGRRSNSISRGIQVALEIMSVDGPSK